MPGLLASTTALTVYKLDNHAAVTTDKLKQYAFRSIDDIPEAKGWGWVNIDDIFDAEWQSSVPEKGQFFCFALRLDSRKVAPAVLKKHLAEAYRVELEKSGNASISRARKKELKELHTSRLLAKTEPVPASIDVALDSSTGLLYVGTNSRSFLNLFEEQLTKSFEVTPVRMTLGGLEERHDLDEQSVETFMEQIYKASMHGMQVTFNEHSYTVSEAGHAMLTSMGEDAMEVSSKNAPGTTDLSLESGMVIKKMKIAIIRDDEDLRWELTLNNDFSFSQLKTPATNSSASDDDADAALLEKLYLIEQAVSIMHTLFRQTCGA